MRIGAAELSPASIRYKAAMFVVETFSPASNCRWRPRRRERVMTLAALSSYREVRVTDNISCMTMLAINLSSCTQRNSEQPVEMSEVKYASLTAMS